VAQAFERELQRGLWEPWDEEYEEQALRGELSEAEWEGSRWLLEEDPVLAAEFYGLKEERVKPKNAPPHTSFVQRIASVAALLALLSGALWWWTHAAGSKGKASEPGSGPRVSAKATIFADGFESGSLTAWERVAAPSEL
jgi:hypothetical protein